MGYIIRYDDTTIFSIKNYINLGKSFDTWWTKEQSFLIILLNNDKQNVEKNWSIISINLFEHKFIKAIRISLSSFYLKYQFT